MQPRKSKALIITFIITLVLLILGYFLVVKGGILKGDSSILGKKFAPILGTPKQKDLVVNDNNNDTATSTDTTTPPIVTPPTDSGGTTEGGNDTGGTPPIPSYTPPNLSFPQPSIKKFQPWERMYVAQCNDNIDNDKDGSTDSADNDCHSDGDNNNTNTYNPSDDSEIGSKNKKGPDVPTPEPDKKKNLCDAGERPLVFTADEQAELDKLTREFYRLAPQLKTENDITNEILSRYKYEDLISNATNLTKQCYEQTGTQAYLQNDFLEEKLSPLTPNDGVTFANGHNCKTDPNLCHDNGRILSEGFYVDDGGPDSGVANADGKGYQAIDCAIDMHACHEIKKIYYNQPGDTLISMVHKGRRERVRNPYFDSSKMKYPFEEMPTYVMQSWIDPRSTSYYKQLINGTHTFAIDMTDAKKSDGGEGKTRLIYNPKPPKVKNQIRWLYEDSEKSWGVW
ncbi:hypothetical protein IT400_01150 [Candidatus Nomurabacteria bacterium]|nr:hypothetical protein [Candidatus Nomurabacteria bacterium]